jgi:hypothetical protein
MVETEKVASMVIYATVFQALLNRVEALEMDRDNAVVQVGNLRIEIYTMSKECKIINIDWMS